VQKIKKTYYFFSPAKQKTTIHTKKTMTHKTSFHLRIAYTLFALETLFSLGWIVLMFGSHFAPGFDNLCVNVTATCSTIPAGVEYRYEIWFMSLHIAATIAGLYGLYHDIVNKERVLPVFIFWLLLALMVDLNGVFHAWLHLPKSTDAALLGSWLTALQAWTIIATVFSFFILLFGLAVMWSMNAKSHSRYVDVLEEADGAIEEGQRSKQRRLLTPARR
jgi:hypothetical protein